VLIDANVVIKDPALTGTASSVLLTYGALGTITVAIPEVALDEAIHDFCEQAKKTHGEIQRHLKTLTRLGLEAEVRMQSLEDLCAAYEGELKRWLRKNQVKVLDYPTIGHREIARMAIDKRRPFDERGRGYRDMLIWLGVVDLVTTSDVWFVSDDNDFRTQDSEQLAPVLVEDIKAAGRSADDVRLFRSLSDCVAELGNSIGQPKVDIGERLGNDAESRDYLVEAINDELHWSQVDVSTLPHPLSIADAASIDSILNLEQIYVTDAREVNKDELFVRIDTIIEVELELLIDKSEVATVESEVGHALYVAQWDFNQRYLRALASAKLQVFLNALVDAHKFDLKKIEVDEWAVVNRDR
jgi:hypothetical protein